MFLVDQIKGEKKAWEVKWAYMPWFMGMDYKMQKALTEHLNATWSMIELDEDDPDQNTLARIDHDVIQFVTNYYRDLFEGVGIVLAALHKLNPIQEVDERQLKTGT